MREPPAGRTPFRLALSTTAAVFLWVTSAAAQPVAAPVLKWQRGGCFSSWCQSGWYGSPAIADLDGDGSQEVVWASYDLVSVDGATGTLEWRSPNASRSFASVAVADLTGDGKLEIVVGRNSDQVVVHDRLGNVLWTARPFGLGEVRTLAVADLEKDGILEVVAGRAGSGATKQLTVLQPDGTVRPGWPARRDGEPGYGWGMFNQNVALGDVNGDGFRELVGPTDTHYITALDRAGNQLPANAIYGAGKVWSQVGVHVDHAVDLRGYANCGTEHRPNFANSAPVIADLNGDGAPEVVVVGNVHDCSSYLDLYEIPFVFRGDRTRWSGSGYDWTSVPSPRPGSAPLSEDYDVTENNAPNPVVADLDGDGMKEILHSSYDGKLHAYWLDKTEHGSWPYSVPGAGIRFASEPAVADLDNDGRAEVLFTSWPDKTTRGTGQLHVLDFSGSLLWAVSLPAPVGSAAWNGALGAPTLADIDGDGELEAVVGTVSSGLVAYDLPGTTHARVLWATGRGSFRRDGAVPVSEQTASSVWHNWFAVDRLETPMVGDFDANGKTDIITFTRQNPAAVGDVYVALSDGTRFGDNTKWHDWFAISTAETVVIGDYDGDGKDDIATWLGRTTRQVYVARSLGTGMTPETVWLGSIGYDPTDVILAGDADGDGKDDLVDFARRQGKVYVALSTGTSFQAPVPWHSWFAVSTYERPRVADVNGDGRSDIVTFATDSPTASGDVYVALSDGTRFGDNAKWHDWFAVAQDQRIRIGDVDGDGREDFFTFMPSPMAQCYVVRSQGTSMAENVLWPDAVAAMATDTPEVGDVNGDGKSDVVVFAQGEGKVRVSLGR